jgi:hypothetical protein
MRFVAELEQAQPLVHVCSALQNITTKCALHMTRSKWIFLIPDQPTYSEGMCVNCELKQKTLFSKYRIESKVNHNILLELSDLAAFTRAMKSALNSRNTSFG